MKLVSVRVITADIDRLVAFYERILGISAERPVPIFAEFRTAGGTLAIGAEATLAPFGRGRGCPGGREPQCDRRVPG